MDTGTNSTAPQGLAVQELPIIQSALRRHQSDVAATRRWHRVVRAEVGQERLPRQLGPFQLRRLISSGGMGNVYEAAQERPQRIVAVKLMRHGIDNPRLVSRFKAEAEFLGRLRHPGIGVIYEAGAIDTPLGAQPYFAMEYVDGETLLDHADLHDLDSSDRLRLFAKVCDAVQHAHRQGIIHRDLKPANILVDASGHPKVLDFGLSRAIDDPAHRGTLHTQIGEAIGTVPYMSPEQVAGENEAIDVRCDVYALGVVGYELLSGLLPLAVLGKSLGAAIQVIRNEPPVPLGKLDGSLRGDIETVFAKALEKSPADRYSSAAELADDIWRYLDRRPVLARRVGWGGRLVRWCRREPGIAALLTVILLLLSTVTIVSLASLMAVDHARNTAVDAGQQLQHALGREQRLRGAESEARRLAEEILERNRRQLYAAEMNLALTAFERGDDAAAQSLVERQIPARPQHDLRGPEWSLLRGLVDSAERRLSGHSGQVRGVAFSPGASLLASYGEDGRILLWETADWQLSTILYESAAAIEAVAFSPDGSLAALGDADRRVFLLDLATRSIVRSLEGNFEPARTLAFTPDGKYLVGAMGHVVETNAVGHSLGEVLAWNIAEDGPPRVLHRGPKQAADLAVSADGQIAVAIWNSSVLIWNDLFADAPQQLSDDVDEATCLAFSPDGSTLAVGSWGSEVILWDVAAEQVRTRINQARVCSIAFNRDGSHIYLGNRGDAAITVRETSSGRRIDTLRGHLLPIRRLACADDAFRLASAGLDGMVRIWRTDHQHGPLEFIGHRNEIDAIVLSSDGRRLASSGRDQTVRIWDAHTGQSQLELAINGHSANGLDFSADARWLATGGREVAIWDTVSGEALQRIAVPELTVCCARFTPDGRSLLAGTFARGRGDEPDRGGLLAWDCRTWEPLPEWTEKLHAAVIAIEFSPDGNTVAYGGSAEKVFVRDLATGRLLQTLEHVDWVASLAFSPDGHHLAAGCWATDGGASRVAPVKVWSVGSGEEVASLEIHSMAVSGLNFSPDGTTLVSGGSTGDVCFWDTDVWQSRMVMRLPKQGWVFGSRFSPGGEYLYCSSGSLNEPGEVIRYVLAAQP